TVTAILSSARGAGPESTAPVLASYTEPWHGHWSCLPSGATVQPWCVQIALKHEAVVLVGRATRTGWPLSVAATACPTGISASAASPDVPCSVPVPAGARVAGGLPAAEELAPPFPPLVELPQAARARIPAPPRPPTRAARREI